MYYCSSGLHAPLRSLDYTQAIAFIQWSIKFGLWTRRENAYFKY
ncbi:MULTISPECIES: hypothetical protein [Nostocales]|nr:MULTISPECIES: hypothetical protein [Nostocales]